MELDAIPRETLERIEQIGSADLVVGVLRADAEESAGAVRLVSEAVAGLREAARAVVIHNNGTSGGQAPSSNGAEQRNGVIELSCRLSDPQLSDQPQPDVADGYRAVFAVGGKLAARACGVIASDLRGVTPQWIYRLVQPSLEEGFDLVTPCYSGRKFEGLLNKSIIAPLNRALYGARIQNPLGPDFGLSGKLLGRVLSHDSPVRAADPVHLAASITADAVSGGLKICETNVGVRLQPATDWTNLSSLMAQILGPVFLDMERNAAAWQRVRGSRPIPQFGEPALPPEETGSSDVRRLLESFQLGALNLPEIWSLVLPPSRMLEIARLARLPANRFHMPDELWASVVFDFAMAHRLRTISRDHLVRSMTPLYLGWVASYALENESAAPEAVESRLDRLSQAYEAAKPYLVSRWRWPDRFNP